jgi:hypothetical protein
MQAGNVGRKLRNNIRLKREKRGKKDRSKKDIDVEKTGNYRVKKYVKIILRHKGNNKGEQTKCVTEIIIMVNRKKRPNERLEWKNMNKNT